MVETRSDAGSIKPTSVYEMSIHPSALEILRKLQIE